MATTGDADLDRGSGATSYTIGRSTVSGGPYATVGTATSPTFLANGLTNGTTFFFVVSATTVGPGCVSPIRRRRR